MKFGVHMFATDYSMDVVELGRAVEDLGFESLFIPEHTHIPTNRRSPYPAGGELPQQYSHSIDPFLALSAVAAVTTRLRVGTGICLVIERDPIVLAKEISSLDHLSGGRFMFGIGGGWNYEEMENHGTEPRNRWKLLRERIEAMKQIWTHDEAEYHGEFVNFAPIWQWPKPVQRPHPPILIGGDGARTLQRVIRYGDEWMPNTRRGRTPVRAERIEELKHLAEQAGRGSIPVTAFNVSADRTQVEACEALGIARCIFDLPPAASDEVLPALKQCSEVAASFAL
jgi:probable F420-dependent oxidoreductase